jgi:S1-C subfamily serine protease
MKRVIATLSMFMLFLVATPVYAQWPTVANQLRESIVYIEGKQGSCTGFVIDNERDFVLTAAHCDMEELYVDLAPAKVRAKDVKNDLMVLHVEGIDRPALKLAKKNPQIGEEVATYGYGWGLERPLFRVSYISDTEANIQTGLPNQGPFFVVDKNFMPGQSGGPVVNVRNEVVSIVQLGSNVGMGLGVGAELIESKVGKYFSGGK